ncbi:MAG TPA: glycosyltransferase, partial [Thermoplasmata archaeon]|nr:glycosyltransferase [Thermoplasmata archaeon]
QEATANVIASQAEGFGLTVLEAGAVGTPTVAVDLPVFRELIRDRASGVLVPQDDASALADALRWVCDHPELREGARTVAVQYPWDATAQRFVGLVERALGTVA